MDSIPTAKPSDDPHDILVVAPDAVRVAPAEDELSSLLHEAAARHGLDSQSRAAADVSAGPTVPPVDTTFRPAAVGDVALPGKRWSLVGAGLRAFAALLLPVGIGVVAVVWQSHGDTFEAKIATWTTQLVRTASLPPTTPALPAPVVVADAANAPAPSAPPAQAAAQGVAPPADAAQLQSMSRDLASLGQQVEQLKASIEELKTGQQQASRDIAKTSELNKVSEPNARPRISPPPLRAAVARQRKPMPPYLPAQAAAVAPALPQAAAAPYPAPAPYYPPNYPPRQTEYLARPPQPQYAAEPPADPELSSVPRPPMPLRIAQ